MTARDKLYAYAGTPCVLPERMLDEALDAYRAEVVAERDGEIVRWLGKKAREYRAEGTKHGRAQADTAAVLASKISRGAVRPNNTLMLPDPGFFEVDRTYTREHHGETITFVVHAVSTSPDGRTTVAQGWRITPYTDGGWEPADSDDFTGWTEVTEAGEAPVTQHYDKVPDPADGCHWCACGNRWPCKDAPAPDAESGAES